MSDLLVAWRRLRLATRLALGIGVLAFVVFAVVGTVLVTTMRGYLAERLDEQLTASQSDQLARIRNHYGPPKAPYQWYTALYQMDNGVAKAQPGGVLPDHPEKLAAVAQDATRTEVLRTVYLDKTTAYRVRACPVDPGGGAVLVSAAPEDDGTVQRLIMVVGAAFILALGVLVFVGRMVLRKGLRPLSNMADTAHDIAGRDLTKSAELPVRVSGDGGGVEVEELRSALNRMLEHIDGSLTARAAANDQLRRFVADASHELRTPLTSIRGYADLFSYAAANEPAERDAHLAKIRAETTRMSVLVDDLLLLARLDSPEQEALLRLERTDISEVAAAAGEAFRAAHPDHPLTVGGVGEPLWLDADSVRLRQVVDNLLANVAAHTPSGTAATLSVRRSGEFAELAVADEGPGIPAEHLGRVFDRFYRVDDSRARRLGGTGLGLAVVQLLVRAHGGTVTVESRPGSTAFTVRLPS